MKRLQLIVIPFVASGCIAAILAAPSAVPMVGNAIRGSQKTTDFVLANGVTPAILQQKKNIGLSINGMDQNGRYLIYGLGTGTENANVFSDMISKEFLRLGYQSRVILDTISEMMPAAKRSALAAQGFDMVLVGNLNVAMSTSYGSVLTGGDWAKTGVTSFTVKGLDVMSGSVLFILSSEYGKAKDASRLRPT